MKNKASAISLFGVLILLLLFMLFDGLSMAQKTEDKTKKKLYISTIKANGVPAAIANRVKEGIRLAIFEGFGAKYQVLDDDAIKVMYKQAESIMASGCSDTSCITQIADGINADEIIYGEVRMEGAMVRISATALERDNKSLSLGAKSMATVDCLESQVEHYAREVGKKLMDKGYRIKKADEDIDGKISLMTIKTEKIGEIKGGKGIEGLGIAVLTFSTPEESLTNILAVLKNYIREGDASFQSGDYDGAVAKYGKITERVESAIRPESKQKLDSFVVEVKKRLEAAYGMKYKLKIDKADPILSSGDYKAARSLFNTILEDMNKNVPVVYLSALKELDIGLRHRLDATWAVQFKKDVEKLDKRLQGRESADESFLNAILEGYAEVETGISKVPAEARGDSILGIKKALHDRKDSVIITIVALHHKKGDTFYGEYKFDKAKIEYDAAFQLSRSILDGKKRANLERNSTDKLNACLTTGKNYLASRIKSFVDRAEVYNLEEKISDANRMMKEAYKLINGPMQIFATVESVGMYNSMADVLKIDRLNSDRIGDNKIGNRIYGSTGGWIFYDKGDYSEGWRYLEAATEDQGRAEWGCYNKSIPGAKSTILGAGKSNTQAIVKECGEENIAVKKCTEYHGGGKSDWFLPSKDELNLMYIKLKEAGFSDFVGGGYWSSSEYDINSAWYQNFTSGFKDFNFKGDYRRVRAIRAF